MPSDKLTFLEQLSNALAGQSATSGAKALGEGIGYGFSGGALSDIPDVMREAIESHREKSAIPQSKPKQDALELASALAAMSNPVSLAGHAVDFAGAVPSMIQQKLSGEPLPTGQVMESGLKRRLAKGGAQADFAMANQLDRAKAKIAETGTRMSPRYPEDDAIKMMPLLRQNVRFPEGEGKFQKISKYGTSAFDLNKATNPLATEIDKYVNFDMGEGGGVIRGKPHELGIEFAATSGLLPRYRGQGYGQQIYQNLADEYGGGISHIGSTTPAARKVYERLGGIDTGIPSGGGTRQALPTRAMKADPEAMAAFEQKVKEYSIKKTKPKTLDDLLEGVDDYNAQSIYDVMVGDAQANRPVSAEQLADMIFSSTGEKRSWRDMPRELDLEGEIYVRTSGNKTYRKRQP